jgi:N-ethylmaleimide reductase
MSKNVDLFSSLQLGDLTLENRILMAPLTRCRSDVDVANALMAEHYAQRASSGLLIAEATAVMANQTSFMGGPGIYSPIHVEGWQQVTEAVHRNGGKIFLQIWHGGRAAHPDLNKGIQPVAASALPITNDQAHTPEGSKPYPLPRALELHEIPDIVAGFKQAAIYAKDAGFDGVEVHGANGYLLDNFLRDGSNIRTDAYGGPIENRARLLFEVLEAVIEVWGSGRVGLRSSPLNGFNSTSDSDPVGLTKWLAEHLNPFNLAYWHVMRADFMGEQSADIMSPARELYKGNLIGNMGYSFDEATTAVADGQLDAVAFGVPFLANPDLVERFRSGAALNEPDQSTFYGGGAEGYTDYPSLAEA